ILLEKPEALLIAATLIGISMTGKWGAAFLTQLLFKYSNAQRQVIYGLSGAHAAATLAIIMVGHEYGIVGENALNGTIILILASCIIASLVTESASKKIVVAGEQDIVVSKRNIAKEEQLILPIANLNNMEALLDFATFIKSK